MHQQRDVQSLTGKLLPAVQNNSWKNEFQHGHNFEHGFEGKIHLGEMRKQDHENVFYFDSVYGDKILFIPTQK